MERAVVYAALMLLVQQFEHTSLNFSLLYFGFVVLSALAFNLAGGFRRVVGAYVFFYSLLTCVIGVTWKAVLGERADSNLASPQLVMATYTFSMVLLIGVILLVKHFDLRPYSMAQRLDHGDLDYTLAGLGCLVVGVAITYAGLFLTGGPGSLLGILIQLNAFTTLGIILSTIGVMRDSHGRRGMGFVNGLALFIATAQGTLAFSKQGMLTPGACWVLSACYMRFKLRTVHFLCLAVFAGFAFGIAPTWATGRDDVPEGGLGLIDNIALVVYEAQHYQSLRERVADVEAADREFGAVSYFNNRQGLLDRLVMLPPDDSLLTYTQLGHYYGYSPLWANFENWMPHFILPDKPPIVTGNTYAHEVGGLAPDDFTTGVSYSPVGEAFHLGGWTGLLLLLPSIWLLFFEAVDFVVGDIRHSLWPLLSMVGFTHSAAESLLSGIIYQTFYGNLTILFAMIFTTQLAPVLGALFFGKRADPMTPGEAARGRGPAKAALLGSGSG
jgi:hypothetical protein